MEIKHTMKTESAVIRLPDGTEASAKVTVDGVIAFTPVAVNGRTFHKDFEIIQKFEGESFITF